MIHYLYSKPIFKQSQVSFPLPIDNVLHCEGSIQNHIRMGQMKYKIFAQLECNSQAKN